VNPSLISFLKFARFRPFLPAKDFERARGNLKLRHYRQPMIKFFQTLTEGLNHSSLRRASQQGLNYA
jgi:hypothetical protein